MIHTALPPFSFLSKENKMDDSDQIPAISTRTVTTSPRGQGEVGTPPPPHRHGWPGEDAEAVCVQCASLPCRGRSDPSFVIHDHNHPLFVLRLFSLIIFWRSRLRDLFFCC